MRTPCKKKTRTPIPLTRKGRSRRVAGLLIAVTLSACGGAVPSAPATPTDAPATTRAASALEVGIYDPSVPAFTNSDLALIPGRDGAIPAWSRLGSPNTLAASYRRCGDELLNVKASTLGFPADLGGDYWDVPMPVDLPGRRGDCALVVNYQASTPIVITPNFTPAPGQRWLTFYSYVPEGEVNVELRSSNASLHSRTLKVGAFRNVIDLSIVAAGKTDLHLIFTRKSPDASALVLTDFRLTPDPISEKNMGARPLGGFADTHTHPMANLAFGGTLVYGDARASWPAGDFGSCKHDWGGGGDVNKSLFTSAMEPAGHAGEGGYPDFKYWPRFNSILHQQLHANWLRRAWQGGQRLIVFHAVNNALLARYFRPNDDPQRANDMVTAYQQIAAMKELVAANSDFMKIALTPAEARQIIRDGRLAVILGIEVDSLFGCHEKPGLISEQGLDARDACTDAWVDTELPKLYDAGVRHVFPVHLSDNEFAGAAVYRSSFARFTNWFRGKDMQPTTAQPGQQIDLHVEQGWDLFDDTLGPWLANLGSGTGNFSFGEGPHRNSRGLDPGVGERTIQKLWDLRGLIQAAEWLNVVSRFMEVSDARAPFLSESEGLRRMGACVKRPRRSGPHEWRPGEPAG